MVIFMAGTLTQTAKTPIMLDGSLADWLPGDRIDRGANSGYRVYARADGDDFVFAVQAPGAIGANTTAWLNTDRDTATGYQIFGFAGGAEYNVNFDANGIASLYTGSAGQTLVKAGLDAAYSADRSIVEFRVAKADIGTPAGLDALFDVNDQAFLPGSYSERGFTVFDTPVAATDHPTRIGIVYSETTANAFFDKTAYSQLFMAAQTQAIQAGVPFDLLTEADLTDLAKLSRYDTLLFPSFRNVEAAQVNAIANTLEQATKQFGIGLITAGEFMTNDATGAALAGDSYARMKLFFDATRVAGGFPASIDVTATDAARDVLTNFATGELVRHYDNVGWSAFASVSGAGRTVATQTIAGQSYAAVMTSETGGRNVLFSTESVMADSNMLWQAIDHSVHGSGVSVGLQMTRNSGIVAARNDMDQSQYAAEVNPDGTAPGIYDQMLPILDQWKAAYNFVGSYYVNVGADAAAGEFTDWSVSGKVYAQLLAGGNEIGTHSFTHPHDTNVLTPEQIAYEFGASKAEIERQMSAYLGRSFTIEGAAVPGAPEKIATSAEILKYVDYLSGGYSGVGAGYPSGVGYLSPALAGKTYIAPNTSFDFTLVEFQKRTPAEAAAIWEQEWNALTAKGEAPIVVWPWHDYGPTAWSLEAGTASPYNRAMFESWIARAAASGAEFVTLADLANRTDSFAASGITSKVDGNVITATVTSAAAGTFALDVDGQGAQVIRNAGNWYAFDRDSVFLPATGGTFTITLGAAADDVTHITALPMRAELLSVTGDGTNLAFAVNGEGQVVIDLRAQGSDWVQFLGATLVSQAGELATLDVGAIGRHDVSVTYHANVAPVIDSNGGGATAAIALSENSAAVTTVRATDGNGVMGDTLSYRIDGGADAALFQIDAKTGALAFRAAPDFELPADAGRNNVYDVVVGVSDARGTADSQALAISVRDVAGVTRTGTSAADTLAGSGEADTLAGSGGNDVLSGLGGNDILFGGAGRDTMTGGAGNDVFRYTAVNETGTSSTARDVITDFVRGQDRIDLSAIDANSGLFSASGNQAFTFLATPGQAFTGAGQLGFRYETIGGVVHTIVSGNVDLLRGADFSITLVGQQLLTASDFML